MFLLEGDVVNLSKNCEMEVFGKYFQKQLKSMISLRFWCTVRENVTMSIVFHDILANNVFFLFSGLDRGKDFCKPYKNYCKQITTGGQHQAFMKKYCAESCKILTSKFV